MRTPFLAGPNQSRLQRFRAYAPTFWALVDQGVVSLGSFITMLVLARELSTTQYGSFILMLNAALVLNSVQNALVGYPLIVHGATQTEIEFRKLGVTALHMTLVFALVLGLLCIAPYVVISSHWLIGLAALGALVCWQVQLTSRNALIARSRFKAALVGDSIAWIGQALFVSCLIFAGNHSLSAIILIISMTSLAGAFIQHSQLQLAGTSGNDFTRSVGHFIATGRWVLLGAIVSAVFSQSLLWALARSGGTAAAAQYQAVTNILGASHPIILSIGNVVLPAVAVAVSQGGLREARRSAVAKSAPLAILLAPYFGLLLLTAPWVLEAVYGSQSEYADLVLPLRLLVLAYCLFFVASVIGSLLNGAQRSRSTLVAQIAGALTSLVLGVPLAIVFGVSGAAAALAISFGVWVLVGFVMIARSERQETGQQEWTLLQDGTL